MCLDLVDLKPVNPMFVGEAPISDANSNIFDGCTIAVGEILIVAESLPFWMLLLRIFRGELPLFDG